MEGRGERKNEEERKKALNFFLNGYDIVWSIHLYTYTHTNNGILKYPDKMIEAKILEVVWSDIKLYERIKFKNSMVKSFLFGENDTTNWRHENWPHRITPFSLFFIYGRETVPESKKTAL